MRRHATRSERLTIAVDHGPSCLSVTALGEVDAGNAKRFADQVCAAIAGAGGTLRAITVDLSGLAFFAVDGCAALHAVNALVMRLGAAWSVVPGPEVSRVLQLCDPVCLIPVTRPHEVRQLATPA